MTIFSATLRWHVTYIKNKLLKYIRDLYEYIIDIINIKSLFGANLKHLKYMHAKYIEHLVVFNKRKIF